MPSLSRSAAFSAPRILNELVRLTDSIFRNTLPSAIDDSHGEGSSGVFGSRVAEAAARLVNVEDRRQRHAVILG